MDIANIIISATSLVVLLVALGAAALHYSRSKPPMPPLPQWDDDDVDEAGEQLAQWRRELNTPSLPDEDKR